MFYALLLSRLLHGQDLNQANATRSKSKDCHGNKTCNTYKMLIISNSSPMDSLRGSRGITPAWASLACCSIFCVLDIRSELRLEQDLEPICTYSYRTKPPNTARPPYSEMASAIASPRMPRGRAIGAKELSATTVTPASRGPPMYKYLSFL